MSVLSDDEIRWLVEDTRLAGTPLISPFDPHAVEGASYDMRLGPLMVISGKPKQIKAQVESHTLQPGDFVVLTTTEKLQLPIDIVGHNGIMSPWARAGLVSLFSPQIDPGFVGVLEVPVFNAGDAPIELIPGRRIFTVEFVRMSAPASFAWVDRHGPKNPPSDPLPPSALRPNLSDLQDLAVTVDRLKTDLKELGTQLATDRTSTDNRLEVVNARISGMSDLEQRRVTREGVKFSRRQVWWAALAVLVAVLVGILSFALGGGFKGSATPRQDAPSATTNASTSTAPARVN